MQARAVLESACCHRPVAVETSSGRFATPCPQCKGRVILAGENLMVLEDPGLYLVPTTLRGAPYVTSVEHIEFLWRQAIAALPDGYRLPSLWPRKKAILTDEFVAWDGRGKVPVPVVPITQVLDAERERWVGWSGCARETAAKGKSVV